MDRQGNGHGPTDADLVYRTSRWQRLLYGEERQRNEGLVDCDRRGQEKAERYADFQRELFGRLYSQHTVRLDEPAENSDWAQQLHGHAEELPEFKQLRTRTRGDELWSGMATSALSNTLLSTMKPRESNKNTERLRRRLESLEEMGRNGIEGLQGRIAKARRQLEEAKAEAEAMAKGLDPTAIRKGLRAACRQAQQEIDDAEEQMQAISFGSEPGSPDYQTQTVEAKRDLAAHLRRNQHVQKIAKMAGRLRRIALAKQKSKCEHAKDQVDSVEQGADLDRLLPSELALLADGGEDLEALFFAKLLERKTLQYRLTGRQEEGRGAIAVCVDVSGSMGGEPDAWAKAYALAILDIARKQKRGYSLTQFDSRVQRVDVFKRGEAPSTKAVLEAMAFFSGGGTSFEEPLREAMRQINDDSEFKKADILFVTDGCAPLSDGFVEEFLAWKGEREVTMFCVLVSPYADAGVVQRVADHVYSLADIIENEEKFQEQVFKI